MSPMAAKTLIATVTFTLGDELVEEKSDQREQIKAQAQQRPSNRPRHAQTRSGVTPIDRTHLLDLAGDHRA